MGQDGSNYWRWRDWRRLGGAVCAERLGRAGVRPRPAGRTQDWRSHGQCPPLAAGLTDVALPPEGKLSFHETIAEAVRARHGFRKACRNGWRSNTRPLARCRRPVLRCGDRLVHLGLQAVELQQGAARPEQIMVAHPFNPVYLLPLIELVPGNGGTRR